MTSVRIWILGFLGLWNLIVLITYGIDKRRAIRQDWRIPEKVLLWEAFLLGGLGALLAGRCFHHKTRKWYFQVVWYLGILVLAAAIYALFTYL